MKFLHSRQIQSTLLFKSNPVCIHLQLLLRNPLWVVGRSWCILQFRDFVLPASPRQTVAMLHDPMLFDGSVWPVCIDMFHKFICLELSRRDLLGAVRKALLLTMNSPGLAIVFTILEPASECIYSLFLSILFLVGDVVGNMQSGTFKSLSGVVG